MAKKQKKETLEDLIPDAGLRKRVVEHLYSKKPLFSEGSVFSELLQNMVNKILEGEILGFLYDERDSGKKNKRNGYTTKLVRSSSGPLLIRTPRDRNGDFEPELYSLRTGLGLGNIEHRLTNEDFRSGCFYRLSHFDKLSVNVEQI